MSENSPRAWETVLRSVESDLRTGRLGPGDHLQPERALATRLEVSRASVREAFRVLEVFGLISTKAGSGPGAGAVIIAQPSEGMSTLMRLQLAAQGFEVRDVVETRLILESAVVGGLAEAPPGDLSQSHQLLDAMRRPELSEAEFLLLDAQFHLSLAQASGNEVIASIMGGLRSSVENYVIRAVPYVASWAVTVARLRKEHEAILGAIESGESTLARKLIRDHIEGYYTETVAQERQQPNRAAGAEQPQ